MFNLVNFLIEIFYTNELSTNTSHFTHEKLVNLFIQIQ